MKFSRSEPGLAISAAIHFGLLAAMLVYMSRAPKFDAQEAVPVDMITDAQFSQIMKGEKHAKVATGKPRVDRVAEVVEHKPTPATPKAKRDVQAPPSPLKREKKPSQAEEDHKPDPKVPVPPPRPAPPPVKAQPKHEKPPEKKAAVLPAHPPPPPPRPHKRHKPKPLKLDQVAKLLREIKDKPVHHRRASGEESHRRLSKPNLDEIARMLSHEAPQARGSSGRHLNKVASLGAPNASAARMSPSLSDALNGLLQEQYRQCWSYLNFSNGPKYVAKIHVSFLPDGSLASEPVLINPPNDETGRMLADSALRAVQRCNPLKIPAKFQPYYQQWKDWVVGFDPDTLN